MCDMKHMKEFNRMCLQHDVTYVPWLIYMCDMTRSDAGASEVYRAFKEWNELTMARPDEGTLYTYVYIYIYI